MKYTFQFACLLILSFAAKAQVGINTTSPTATLDVNGTVRIQKINNPSIVANKVIGVDDAGNLRELAIGDNIRLVNNKLVAINKTLQFGSINPLSAIQNDDVNFLIWPGEANDGKSIMRIVNDAGDTEITGIKAGTDGMHIWLYAYSGMLTLIANSTDSATGNRIETSEKMSTSQYGMIELVYDGTLGKWIIMYHHD